MAAILWLALLGMFSAALAGDGMPATPKVSVVKTALWNWSDSMFNGAKGDIVNSNAAGVLKPAPLKAVRLSRLSYAEMVSFACTNLSGADIEKDSIQVRRGVSGSGETIGCAVMWRYTEAGAKKMIAQSSAPAEWKRGWLNSRTDKCIFRTGPEARTFAARLKNE